MKLEGKITRTGTSYELRYERILKHSIEKVWEALSEFEHLKEWFNVLDFEKKIGGIIVTKHDDKIVRDRILTIKDNILEHTWWEEMNPHGIVQWKLARHPDGCLLTLIYTSDPKSTDNWAQDMTGWHIILDLLYEYLNGIPVDKYLRPHLAENGYRVGGTGPYEKHSELEDRYSQALEDFFMQGDQGDDEYE